MAVNPQPGRIAVGGPGNQVVLAAACRTPLAPRNGALGGCHPADLLAALLQSLVNRTGVEPGSVGDVIAGCSTAIGAQALNVGRQAVLAAGWPESVPGLTLDRQAASGLDALVYGIAAVQAGLHDVVVAAGVEAMTLVPAGAAVQDGSFGLPFGPAVHQRYRAQGGLLPAGQSADAAAAGWLLDRDELDRWALHSHRRAAAAADAGRLAAEVVPVGERRLDREARRPVATGRRIVEDETLDRKLTAESLAACRPTYSEDGVTTAANTAAMADGAAAVLLLSEARAASLGLTPLVRLRAAATRGADPRRPLDAPLDATAAVLDQAGLGALDLDRAEVDESFAAVPLGWLARFGLAPERVNPDGGAIGLGLPLGAGGLRALVSLVHGLASTSGPSARSGGGAGTRLGLVTAGAIGGVATAVVVESTPD